MFNVRAQKDNTYLFLSLFCYYVGSKEVTAESRTVDWAGIAKINFDPNGPNK